MRPPTIAAVPPVDVPLATPSPFGRVRARTLLAVLVAVPVALEGVRRVIVPPPSEATWDVVGGAAFAIGVGAAVAAYLRWRGVGVRAVVGLAWPRWRDAWLVLLTVPLLVLSLGTGALQLSLLVTLAPGWAARLQDLAGAAAAGPTLAQIAGSAVVGVLAAAMEELLFRGALLGRWAAKWGTRRAVLASSLAFAILHLDLLGSFVFGVVMALLYLRTRSLVVPFLCHAANNLVVTLSDLLDGTYGAAPLPPAPAPALTADWGAAALAIGVAAPVLAWFVRAAWRRGVRSPPPGHLIA